MNGGSIPADFAQQMYDYQDTLNIFEGPDGKPTPLGMKVMKLNDMHKAGATTPDAMALAGGEDSTGTGSSPQDPITVTDAASYAAVPSGAYYITPEGKTKRKP
jgi:hypothetical protein